MGICSFWGHRDCTENVRDVLYGAVEGCILHGGITQFYVGNQGNFDMLVISVLREIKHIYPQIEYRVVLAYLPTGEKGRLYPAEETLFPDGIEHIPKKYAIAYRNKWMLQRSDTVICYVRHGFGCSAKYTDMAVRARKHVLNIVDLL